MMVILTVSVSAFAATVNVTFTNGKTLEGDLISYNDTSLIMEPKYDQTKQIEIKPGRVRYFTASGIGRFIVEDGKFIPDTHTQARMEKQRIDQEAHVKLVKERAANPNKVIGNALKSTGGLCMGIGIPSLVVGTILVAIGNSNTNMNGKPAEIAAITQSKANCATAGYVLMPFGAALTIVGIPLYVHGNRIAEMNINYTGNGAGISVNF